MNDPWSMFFGHMGASFEQAQRNTPPRPPVRPRKPKGKPVARLLKSLPITLTYVPQDSVLIEAVDMK